MLIANKPCIHHLFLASGPVNLPLAKFRTPNNNKEGANTKKKRKKRKKIPQTTTAGGWSEAGEALIVS